jgi:hypothetical protein
MCLHASLDAPTELEFLERLGVEPETANPHDGFWRYRLSDADGTSLSLSFNTIEASVQVVLECRGRELVVLSQEGAVKLECDSSGRIRGEFRSGGWHSTITIETNPSISVVCAALVDRG